MTERHRIESDQQPDPTPSEQSENARVNPDGRSASIPTENLPDSGEARPEWLHDKFQSPEELAKAYSELEKKFSQKSGQKQEDTPADSDDTSGEDHQFTIQKAEKVAEEAAQAGIDFEALGAEYAENGMLTDETYTDLESKGFPRNVVDAYVEGQKAIAQRAMQELVQVVGTEEDLNASLSWASQNLSDAEIDAYNSAVNGGDMSTAKLLLRGIRAAHINAGGKEPSLVKGETTPRSRGVQPFPSNAEMIAAINDPRYETDPGYRDEVRKRIEAG
jgi:hypothetical protein